MYLNKYQVLQQSDLEFFSKSQEVFAENNPCNIYFILKRPRLSIDPKKLLVNTNSIEIDYFIHIEDEKLKRTFIIPNFYDEQHLKLVSLYPYNYFEIHDNNRKRGSFKLGALIHQIQADCPIEEPLLDFEVLYIGKAYGKDGKRTAIERLNAHEKLQTIYSDAMNNNPDSEIWLMLANFTQNNIATVNGRVKIPQENEAEDLNRFTNFINPDYLRFSEDQRIAFTEAALINCFKPEYNKEYKNSFPRRSHTTYEECYSLDINAMVINVDTSDMNRWLYSVAKPRVKEVPKEFDFWQHEVFYFNNRQDRIQMFNNDYI